MPHRRVALQAPDGLPKNFTDIHFNLPAGGKMPTPIAMKSKFPLKSSAYG